MLKCRAFPSLSLSLLCLHSTPLPPSRLLAHPIALSPSSPLSSTLLPSPPPSQSNPPTHRNPSARSKAQRGRKFPCAYVFFVFVFLSAFSAGNMSSGNGIGVGHVSPRRALIRPLNVGCRKAPIGIAFLGSATTLRVGEKGRAVKASMRAVFCSPRAVAGLSSKVS